MAAQRQYAKSDVQVIGIAIDTPRQVQELAGKLGINYPLLIDESRGMALAKRLGNEAGGLPFTAFVDRAGRVASVKIGALTSHQIDRELATLISPVQRAE